MKKLFYAGALLLLCGPALAAHTLYVQSIQAKLHSEPSSQSPQIATLDRGEAVAVVEKRERWIKVSHGQQTGWISSLVLAGHPPANKITVLDAPPGDDENKPAARLRASSNNTAAATRGLRDGSRARLSSEGQEDYGAVEQMESKPISDAEAVEFLRQGQQP